MKVCNIMGRGHRPSTKRTYNSAQKSYLDFCTLYSLVAMPATEQTILRYIAYISSTVAPQSLHVYLSAVRSLHITHGFNCPPTVTPRISLANKGLASTAPPPKTKTPLTFDILCKIHLKLPSDFDTVATWACMTLAFFACLRAGEIAPCLPLDAGQSCPLVSDLMFGVDRFGQSYMQVNISRTKTQLHGIKVIAGCTGKPVCAVCAMIKYMNLRNINCTALNNSPLFLLSNGSFIHKDYLVTRTRAMIAAIGLDPASYTGHSFRVGAATQASINNMPEFHIQQLGHWKSNAYKTYVHTPIDQKVQYSHILSLTSN